MENNARILEKKIDDESFNNTLSKNIARCIHCVQDGITTPTAKAVVIQQKSKSLDKKKNISKIDVPLNVGQTLQFRKKSELLKESLNIGFIEFACFLQLKTRMTIKEVRILLERMCKVCLFLFICFGIDIHYVRIFKLLVLCFTTY